MSSPKDFDHIADAFDEAMTECEEPYLSKIEERGDLARDLAGYLRGWDGDPAERHDDLVRWLYNRLREKLP